MKPLDSNLADPNNPNASPKWNPITKPDHELEQCRTFTLAAISCYYDYMHFHNISRWNEDKTVVVDTLNDALKEIDKLLGIEYDGAVDYDSRAIYLVTDVGGVPLSSCMPPDYFEDELERYLDALIGDDEAEDGEPDDEEETEE